MSDRYLEIGKIVGVHGIKGEVKAEVWADYPEFIKKFNLLYLNQGKTELKKKSIRIHKKMALVTIEDINTPEEAAKLRGEVLYIDKSDVNLPKDIYFIADLIGLKVIDANTSEYYGVIEEVFNTGANNVYRIINEEKEFLFPAVKPMIDSTDLEEGVVRVKPIPGIFDDGGISDAN